MCTLVIGISAPKLDRGRQLAKIAACSLPRLMTTPTAAPHSHPDRRARTLADTQPVQGGGFALPEAGARDCRIDLKILQWKALRACAQSARARERLRELDPQQRPDVWAGTVQDGLARGFAVALEEAISLAPQTTPPPAPDPMHIQHVTGKELRKRKDLLVKSGGARVRFSRKEGVLFVDRDADTNSPNCLRFEDRADRGSLDAFVAVENERARIFSAQFLQPLRYTTGKDFSELELSGRLGRGKNGFAVRMWIVGRDSESTVELRIEIDHRLRDHRLRARFLGVASTLIAHECQDVREVVQAPAGGFVAFTLVRAIGTLLVDGSPVAVDGAQCQGRITHTFRLGTP